MEAVGDVNKADGCDEDLGGLAQEGDEQVVNAGLGVCGFGFEVLCDEVGQAHRGPDAGDGEDESDRWHQHEQGEGREAQRADEQEGDRGAGEEAEGADEGLDGVGFDVALSAGDDRASGACDDASEEEVGDDADEEEDEQADPLPVLDAQEFASAECAWEGAADAHGDGHGLIAVAEGEALDAAEEVGGAVEGLAGELPGVAVGPGELDDGVGGEVDEGVLAVVVGGEIGEGDAEVGSVPAWELVGFDLTDAVEDVVEAGCDLGGAFA